MFPMTAIDGALRLWFVLTGLAGLFVVYDVVARSPAMTVMKWGWVLVVAYTGPIGLFVYLVSCREPLAGTHERYVAPRWKQAVGSTIHCVAGDATGIIAGALVALGFHLPKSTELVLEYAAGFAFGLFIFQALFAKVMGGGSYADAVARTILPEWLSMNALMAGMIPMMAVLMAGHDAAMEPTGLAFWGAMSAAILVGSVTAYPVNVWLVATGKKHGMGTKQVLGPGGHSASVEHDIVAKHTRRPRQAEVLAMTAGTLAALAIGLAIGARFGVLGG